MFLAFSSPNECTYRECIEAIGNRLTAEFHTQCVFPGILHRIVDAECSIAVVLDVDVQITGI